MKKQKKQEERQSKRTKTKHPNLKKDMNLKTRREYIDTGYVDGVFDNEGNRLIRALTEEEKDWLDKFYSEHVNASFSEDNIHTILPEEKRQRIKNQIKQYKEEVKEIQKEINTLTIKKNLLEDEIKELKEKDYKTQCYDANNSRNRCLYNMARKTGKLTKLKNKEYDEFTSESYNYADLEHRILFQDENYNLPDKYYKKKKK